MRSYAYKGEEVDLCLVSVLNAHFSAVENENDMGKTRILTLDPVDHRIQRT